MSLRAEGKRSLRKGVENVMLRLFLSSLTLYLSITTSSNLARFLTA